MEPPLRAVVSGYYGFHNAGDEAVLAGIIAGIRRAAPDAEITVISGDPASAAQTHQVRAVPRPGVRAWSRELARAHLLISGGGNLFQDVTSARSCLYYLAVLRSALRARVPVAVLGQGIGPLRRRWLRRLVARYLNRVDAIAVRDSESARELARMGVRRPPLRVGADLSFAMAPGPAEAVRGAWGEVGVADAGDVLAVAPRAWRIRGAGSATPAIASAVAQAAAQLEARVAVFPMQRPHDDQIARELAGMAGGVFAGAEYAPGLLAGMLGSARVVVGMRLHALIFAAMGGAAPVAISYDPKIEAFMSDIGRPTAAAIAEVDRDRLAAAIVTAWREDERAALLQAAAQRRRLADEMLAWAVEIARSHAARLGARQA